jgi:hypothetical protein
VGSSRLHRRLYLELDRDLGLDYIYTAARSFQRIYLLLYYIAYRSVLRGEDCILLEQLSGSGDEIICAPEHCLCV